LQIQQQPVTGFPLSHWSEIPVPFQYKINFHIPVLLASWYHHIIQRITLCYCLYIYLRKVLIAIIIINYILDKVAHSQTILW